MNIHTFAFYAKLICVLNDVWSLNSLFNAMAMFILKQEIENGFWHPPDFE